MTKTFDIISPVFIQLTPRAFLEIPTELKLKKENQWLLLKLPPENKKAVIYDYFFDKNDQLIIRILNPANKKSEYEEIFATNKDMFSLKRGDLLCHALILNS